jgi:choice-of-anchor A domain-containing protein
LLIILLFQNFVIMNLKKENFMIKLKAAITGLAGLVFAMHVSADFQDVTGGFNVVTFGDFALENSDVHGAVAAGGNVSISNSFGINTMQPASTTSSAIVAGDNVFLANNGQVNGNVFAGGAISKDMNVNITGSMYGNQDPLPFTADYLTADALSKLYDDATPTNAWASQYSTLSLNGIDDINYYDIDATDLQNVWALEISDQDNYSVINVHGTSATLHYDKMNYNKGEALNTSHILFNFVDAEAVTISSVYGNILAKDAVVSGQYGEMYGCLVSDSYRGHTQFHMGDFTPPQSVPEGSTTAMISVGVLLLLAVSRKKRLFLKK